MKTTITALALALLLAASPVLAQEGGEKEEEYDVAAAMKKVAELLKASEQQIVETLKKQATAGEGAEKARQALDDLLRQGRKSGQDAVDKMTEILKKAPRRGGGGGGGSQKQQEPEPNRPGEQEKPEELDPGNSGDPKDDQESPDEPRSKAEDPPEAKKDPPAEPDPRKDWLALLPPELRKKYQNKNWEEIPRKWKEFLEEYARRLAELESSRDGD